MPRRTYRTAVTATPATLPFTLHTHPILAMLVAPPPPSLSLGRGAIPSNTPYGLDVAGPHTCKGSEGGQGWHGRGGHGQWEGGPRG